MKTYVFGVLLVLITFYISCEKKEVQYQSQDLVFVGQYTSGLEGPSVDQDGNLYFVNPKHSGSVGKVDTEGNFSLFIEHLPEGSTANGIRFGQDQSMYLADYTGHNVLKVNLKSKEVSVYAHDSLLNLLVVFLSGWMIFVLFRFHQDQ